MTIRTRLYEDLTEKRGAHMHQNALQKVKCIIDAAEVLMGKVEDYNSRWRLLIIEFDQS